MTNGCNDFPQLIPVVTSATIKSVDEEGRTREEITRLWDDAVQEFFGTLAGVEKPSIRVLGEELQEVFIPTEAAYPKAPASISTAQLDLSDLQRHYGDTAEPTWGH
jgi:hypothetical protein